MLHNFFPDINKVYYLTQPALFHIISGSGGIQVDFENYFGWTNKAIFLEKGQYVKFLSDDFKVEKMEFFDSGILDDRAARVLFKHLVSLGHIDFSSCVDCNKDMEVFNTANNPKEIIKAFSQQWFLQNPFEATEEEYEVIFDIKEIVDAKYDKHLKSQELALFINDNNEKVQTLMKEKVGLSVKGLWERKRWAESRKEVALTDKSIQEVSYAMGYKDPGYFNRVFKQKARATPNEFRQHFDYDNRDTFVQDIVALVRQHHKEQHQLSFYADKMNLSVKTLQKKTKAKLGDSLGKLIRQEIVDSSKKILAQDASIKEAAFTLGFEEANHFTSFFKRYTGVNPSSFKSEIYN
ncbi:AraC family transcriptional regulator [Allomuricauda sp. d1]|uniref:AraC family transcriptional regulator n=1 Tax=Allomuricauda sp. d1 TaxID=3136725 RepID=UPI0031D08142